MFLAYEVIPTKSSTVALTKPLILDVNTIYNLNKKQQQQDDDDDEQCYVKGRLLGFVEVTQRPYGIANNNDQATDGDGNFYIDENNENKNNNNYYDDPRPLRPVLTNLAVRKSARQDGIGSRLLDACEKYIQQEWSMNEIILEVEDYNTKALDFYLKRGYTVLFSDPASRRYDVAGFWLKKVRCRREIMRKVFTRGRRGGTMMMDTDLSSFDLFRMIRETLR
jgi:ribosomal protein S18 acetylase RimI-like enzyme